MSLSCRETQLKMHLLDLWTKNEESYDCLFAKKIHLTREFYKLPCDQLKIYYKEFIELENSSVLCYNDSTKISRVAALITKLLSECLNIENVLKFIKDEKIDLKDIGYMLAKEKCYVTVLEDGRKKNVQKMEVIFTEKFFILTIYKKPYLNFVEALPLDKIRANFKFHTALVSIIFGEVTRKTYKLTLLNSDTAMNLYHIIKDFITDTIIE